MASITAVSKSGSIEIITISPGETKILDESQYSIFANIIFPLGEGAPVPEGDDMVVYFTDTSVLRMRKYMTSEVRGQAPALQGLAGLEQAADAVDADSSVLDDEEGLDEEEIDPLESGRPRLSLDDFNTPPTIPPLVSPLADLLPAPVDVAAPAVPGVVIVEGSPVGNPDAPLVVDEFLSYVFGSGGTFIIPTSNVLIQFRESLLIDQDLEAGDVPLPAGSLQDPLFERLRNPNDISVRANQTLNFSGLLRGADDRNDLTVAGRGFEAQWQEALRGQTLSNAAVLTGTQTGDPLGEFTITGHYGRLIVGRSTGDGSYELLTGTPRTPAPGADAAEVAAAAAARPVADELRKVGHQEFAEDVFLLRVDDGINASLSRLVIRLPGANDAPTARQDFQPLSVIERSDGGTAVLSTPGVSVDGTVTQTASGGLFANDSDIEATPNPAIGGAFVAGAFQFSVLSKAARAPLTGTDGSITGAGTRDSGGELLPNVLGSFTSPVPSGSPQLRANPVEPLLQRGGSAQATWQISNGKVVVTEPAGHGLTDGAVVLINGAKSSQWTEDVNGLHTVRVLSATTYELDVQTIPSLAASLPEADRTLTSTRLSVVDGRAIIHHDGHGLQAGQFVRLSGLSGISTSTGVQNVNGIVRIEEVVDRDHFTISISGRPVSDAGGGNTGDIALSLPGDALQTRATGSSDLFVFVPGHGLAPGARIELSGAPAVGGIPAANINGVRVVQEVISVNILRISAGSAATLAETGPAAVLFGYEEQSVVSTGVFGRLVLHSDGSWTYTRTAAEIVPGQEEFLVQWKDDINGRVLETRIAPDLTAISQNASLSGTVPAATFGITNGRAPLNAMSISSDDNPGGAVVDSAPGSLLGTFTITGKYGVLELDKDTGVYKYTLLENDPDTQALRNIGGVRDSESETFSYTLADADPNDVNAAHQTAVSKLVISVLGANDAPVSTGAGNPGVTEDTPITVTNVFLNATDTDDPLGGAVPAAEDVRWRLISAPSQGELRLNGTPVAAGSEITQGQITAGLLTYHPNADINGNINSRTGANGTDESFTLRLHDGGEDGAATTDRTLTFTIAAVNDAPRFFRGGTEVAGASVAGEIIEEDLRDLSGQPLRFLGANRLTVDDIDASEAQRPAPGVPPPSPLSVTVTIPAGTGTIQLGPDTGAITGLTLTGTTEIRFNGTVDAVNAALNGLSYTPTANFNSGIHGGPVNLVITVNDNGNSSTSVPGVPLQITRTVPITVNAVNDPISVIFDSANPAALTIDEDGFLLFRHTVADLDADEAGSAPDPVRVELTAPHGAFTLATTAGLSGISGNGTASTVVFNGSLAEVNAALNSVRWNPAPDQNNNTLGSTAQIVINVSDKGNTGLPNPVNPTTASNALAVSVTPVNDAPVLVKTTAAVTFAEDVAAGVIPGLSVSDVDVAETTNALRVTLSLTGEGSIAVNSAVLDGLTVGGISETVAGRTFVLTGTPLQINNTLASGLTYTAVPDFNNNLGAAPPAVRLNITAEDLGASGTGGPLQDTHQVAITVSAVNDTPTLAGVPAVADFPEDSPAQTIAGITVADTRDLTSAAGANSGAVDNLRVTVTINDPNGALAAGGGVITVGTGTNTLTLTGSAAAVNLALTTLSYAPGPNFNGAVTLQAQVSDLGNTGTGGALTASGSTSFNVTAVNNAPVNARPPTATVLDNAVLVFSVANGNAISISDVDAAESGAADPMEVRLTVPAGTLTLATTTGLGSVADDGSASVTITGTVAEVNAALNGLRYTPVRDIPATAATNVALQIVTNDQGNSGAGGALTDTDSVTITVNPFNDAPVNTVPAAQSIAEDVPITFSSALGRAITVSDPDASANPADDALQVTLTVTHGTLALAGTAGLLGLAGNNSGSVSFRGSAAEINAALDGLIFTPQLNNANDATLTVLTSDLGNVGIPPTVQTDSDTILIDIASNNDAPVNTVPAAQVVNEGAALVFSSALGRAISVADSDAPNGAGADALLMTLSVTSGTLTLATTAGLSAIGGNGSGLVTFRGSPNEVNAALNGLTFTPVADSIVPVTLTVLTNDQGNTGGPAESDSDTVAITFTPLPDAPVIANAGGGAVNYSRAGAPVILDNNIAVSDADLSSPLGGVDNFTGYSVLVGRQAAVVATDAWSFPAVMAAGLVHDSANFEIESGGNVIATYDLAAVPGQVTVNFTSANGTVVTNAMVNTVMQSLQFSTAAPVDGTFSFAMTVNDGTGQSASVPASTLQINVGPPVALDLDLNGQISFTGISDASPVIDMNRDGTADHMAAPGGHDGFLVFDQDGSGTLNDRSELLLTDHAPGAGSDLEALRVAFDTNLDGIFTATDADWASFAVWHDLNGDGTAAANELSPLSDFGIISIDLGSNGLFSQPADGVNVLGNGTYTMADGTSGLTADALLAWRAALPPADEVLAPDSPMQAALAVLDQPLPAAELPALDAPVAAAAPAEQVDGPVEGAVIMPPDDHLLADAPAAVV